MFSTEVKSNPDKDNMMKCNSGDFMQFTMHIQVKKI